MAERSFAQNDSLQQKVAAMKQTTNSSKIKFKTNKTGKWIDSKSEEQQDEMILNSLKASGSVSGGYTTNRLRSTNS